VQEHELDESYGVVCKFSLSSINSHSHSNSLLRLPKPQYSVDLAEFSLDNGEEWRKRPKTKKIGWVRIRVTVRFRLGPTPP